MAKKSIYLIKALSRVAELQELENFKVSDLFTGYEWKRITKSDRIDLGGEFLEYINSIDCDYPIKENGITKSNKRLYIIEETRYKAKTCDPDDFYDEEEY